MGSRFVRRQIGRSPSRIVGQWAWHGAPTDARTLLSRVLTPQTRYLVFDLDRTIHLGHNLGELLGWELTAWFAYGAEHWAEAGVHGPVSRFRWDAPTPLALARYLHDRGGDRRRTPGNGAERWLRHISRPRATCYVEPGVDQSPDTIRNSCLCRRMRRTTVAA